MRYIPMCTGRRWPRRAMPPDRSLLLRGMRHNCSTSHEGREDPLKHFRNRMGTFVVSAALVVGGVAPVVLAQTAGEDIKHAGTDTKDAAKDTGHGVAKGP